MRGAVRVPGDKSISHRALILGALAEGEQVIEGFSPARDVRSTFDCLRSLGLTVEATGDRAVVRGRPLEGGRRLDAGNSGTTARLLSGLLASQPFSTTIDGDDSLRARPMERVAEPLRRMGCEITTSPGGSLPMTIRGGPLHGVTYRLPVASAQIKSAILLAGLRASGTTTVEETVPSRDHTERMLDSMSAGITRDERRVSVTGGRPLHAVRVPVPADVSSAAYFVVAAVLLPDSEVVLPKVGVNPGRIGLLAVLRRMGADIELADRREFLREPVADVRARSGRLRGGVVEGDMVPALIDEIPVLAVAATQAEGETTVRDAAELRHKETDRIAAIVKELRRLGADIVESEDGFTVRGPSRLKGARLDSHGDHRIAMALSVAGLVAEGRTEIDGAGVVDVSYPGFFNDLRSVVA